jgi:hypothetical protein
MERATQVAAVAADLQLSPQVGLPAGAMFLQLLLLLLLQVHADHWHGVVLAAEPLQQLAPRRFQFPCHSLQHPALRRVMHNVSARIKCQSAGKMMLLS